MVFKKNSNKIAVDPKENIDQSFDLKIETFFVCIP